MNETTVGRKKSGSAWLAHVIGLRRDAMKPTLPAGIENAARDLHAKIRKRQRERETAREMGECGDVAADA